MPSHDHCWHMSRVKGVLQEQLRTRRRRDAEGDGPLPRSLFTAPVVGEATPDAVTLTVELAEGVTFGPPVSPNGEGHQVLARIGQEAVPAGQERGRAAHLPGQQAGSQPAAHQA